MTHEENAQKPQDRTRALCPTCRGFSCQIVHTFLDSRTGKVIRVFRCRCGEHIWDD